MTRLATIARRAYPTEHPLLAQATVRRILTAALDAAEHSHEFPDGYLLRDAHEAREDTP